ncbi:hypothetical protein HIM_09026 [Hirsutella minnesotensis 3608]|uniref:Reverse transcriptase domain-containing protein n=1 Tax=Hirsutella minnesotensis 3608 TaxID=1043627 RepID=A0A0F7ZXZ0_9HYPO|nr:hypothetical protein HIM_09026 [Hirsutella minnesotensis 3608]
MSRKPGLGRFSRQSSTSYFVCIFRFSQDGTRATPHFIWNSQAPTSSAKYIRPTQDSMDDKVPPLRRTDGSVTKGKGEQAEELLDTFFPPLPARIEPEVERPQRASVAMPDLTLTEIEENVMAAKQWKAPGEDGLPTIVWKKLWHVVKYRVLALFDASLREGVVPHQWRIAKIIPLKKPGKEDYTLAKAWRPISLLSTLGKILEVVVAERISYAVESHGLLTANHFDAGKRRSADQALVLLQERVYKAWRMAECLVSSVLTSRVHTTECAKSGRSRG